MPIPRSLTPAATTRFLALLLSSFGTLDLALGAIGVFGATTFTVALAPSRVRPFPHPPGFSSMILSVTASTRGRE